MAWKDVDKDLTSKKNIVGEATLTMTDCTDGFTWTCEFDDITTPERWVWEWCDNCSNDVIIDSSRPSLCPICRKPIKPCAMCDMDKVNCDECKFDKESKNEHE